jgi:hypothetical protein
MEPRSERPQPAKPREPLRPYEVAVSALALAGPPLAGAAFGHLGAGMAAAVGGMAMGEALAGDTPREQASYLAHALAATLLATLAGPLLSSNSAFAACGIVLLTLLASLLGGASRPLAAAEARFVLFLVITSYVAGRDAHPLSMVPLFYAGAAWGAVLNALLIAWRSMHPVATGHKPQPTSSQRWRRWWRVVRTREGLLHPLQLSVSLAIAEAIRTAWPEHHTHWIALTVAIVVRRPAEELYKRIVERSLGTLAGVLGGSVLLLPMPGAGVLVLVAVLAVLRAIFRNRNPGAYAAVMTPLVLMLAEFGRPASAEVLVDRLAATLIGGALALGVARIFAPRARDQPPG